MSQLHASFRCISSFMASMRFVALKSDYLTYHIPRHAIILPIVAAPLPIRPWTIDTAMTANSPTATLAVQLAGSATSSAQLPSLFRRPIEHPDTHTCRSLPRPCMPRGAALQTRAASPRHRVHTSSRSQKPILGRIDAWYLPNKLPTPGRKNAPFLHGTTVEGG